MQGTLKLKHPAYLPLLLEQLDMFETYQNFVIVISDRYKLLAKHFFVAEKNCKL